MLEGKELLALIVKRKGEHVCGGSAFSDGGKLGWGFLSSCGGESKCWLQGECQKISTSPVSQNSNYDYEKSLRQRMKLKAAKDKLKEIKKLDFIEGL